jgi:DNA topoisomerase-1
MSYTLIIAEKPTAAKAIAYALSEAEEPKKEGEQNRVWYRFSRNNQDYVVVPAVGHLFSLKQKGKGWNYPVFDLEWIPSFQASRFASFSEPYFRNIEKLVGKAKDFIIATDYDDEGEVIGYNILRFICGTKTAARMKFSTMTENELMQAYQNMGKIEMNLVNAGLTRHFLDWYYGINLTRAFTMAMKRHAKRFKILSTGRVQGPVLHMLAKHEKIIKAFKPKPFWELEADILLNKKKFLAKFSKKLWKEEEADSMLKQTKKTGTITKIIKKKYIQNPPTPYNTSAFLADAYRYFGYSPEAALNIAEDLYQKGYISYPRTGAQKFPKDINLKSILQMLQKQSVYAQFCGKILKGKIVPTQGKKDSKAHPPIYPTGKIPKQLGSKQKRVYDLVVRRFLAVFGEPAERESVRVEIDAKTLFYLSGKRTTKNGWLEFYGKYSAREDAILPDVQQGDVVEIKKVNKLAKQTKPPSRFSQGSVIREMENRGLGTEATRAHILQTLYNRGYLMGKSIEVTELGLALSDTLEKYSPDVISEELTREFEKKTEKVFEGKIKMKKVLEEGKNEVEKISEQLKKREPQIGKELTKSVIEAQDRLNTLGPCPKCKDGILKVHKNWRTGKRFVGCTNYAKDKCKFGAPLPAFGRIEPTDKICDDCKSPIIQVFPQGSRPFRTCVDIECPTKKEWLDKKRLKKVQKQSRLSSKAAEKNKCPECNKRFNTARGLAIHSRIHK